jgi:hypothetical protein
MLAYAAAPENRARLEPRNRLLAALPPEDLWRRRPHLEPVTLPRRKVLFEPDERLTRIYLIETAVVSLVTVFEDRDHGRDGERGPGGLVAVGGTAARRQRARLLPA